MNNVIEIFNEFKTTVEKEQFITKQHTAITSLMAQNRKLSAEVDHLKELLLNVAQAPKVERIIITPEEALIERQIELINNRAFNQELTLEDTKKLDLLIKNKRLFQEQSTTIQGESKKLDKKQYSNAELILLASKKDDA